MVSDRHARPTSVPTHPRSLALATSSAPPAASTVICLPPACLSVSLSSCCSEFEIHEGHLDWEAIKAGYDALDERQRER